MPLLIVGVVVDCCCCSLLLLLLVLWGEEIPQFYTSVPAILKPEKLLLTFTAAHLRHLKDLSSVQVARALSCHVRAGKNINTRASPFITISPTNLPTLQRLVGPTLFFYVTLLLFIVKIMAMMMMMMMMMMVMVVVVMVG